MKVIVEVDLKVATRRTDNDEMTKLASRLLRRALDDAHDLVTSEDVSGQTTSFRSTSMGYVAEVVVRTEE